VCPQFPSVGRSFRGYRAGQTNPLYRFYAEHTWLVLGPKEARKVRVMFEFAPDAHQGDPHLASYKLEKYLPIPNRVTMLGLIEDPLDRRLHGPSPVAGAQATAVHRTKTKFARFDAKAHSATGAIVRVSNGAGVPGGKVILCITVKGQKRERCLASTMASIR
jgi:hypothetical protein